MATNSASDSHRTKRTQIAVACDECRTRKAKCDGRRPICTRCADRQRACVYAAEFGAPPIIALKRKHEALQHESAEARQLLSRLKSVSRPDAYQILETLREGEDVASTLRFARALPAPANQSFTNLPNQNVDEGSLTVVPHEGYPSEASVAPDLNSGRDSDCVSVTQYNKTSEAAVERRLDELTKKYDELQNVLTVLTTGDESLAQKTFRRLRAGDPPHRIVQDVQQYRIHSTVVAAHDRLLCRNYLVALLQSTVSLWEIVEMARQILNPSTRINLPSSKNLLPLRSCIITLEALGGIVNTVNHGDDQRGLFPVSELPHLDASHYHDRPLHRVPALPWTNVISSDEDVSQIVATFFVRINTYWRFLEEATFLRSMRLKDVNGSYCSPFLVNSVLACASLFCEADGAFATPGHLLTRGEHFHVEAVRLWTLENGRPSVSNLQALMILGIESCWRGMDRLGLSLVQAAGLMNRELPIPEARPGMAQAMAEYVRVRGCIASTVVHIQVAFAHALGRGPECLTTSTDDAPPLDSILEDTRAHWVDYPHSHQPKPIRPNRLMQERWSLTLFMCQAIQLLPRKGKGFEKRNFHRNVELLANRMESWRRTLPNDLSFAADMPPPLFELHIQWFCIQTTLHDQWLQVCIADCADTQTADPQIEKLCNKLLAVTHASVALICEYRRTYGCKATPAHIFHQASIASFILLRALGPEWPMRQLNGGSNSHNFSVAENAAALEECMRCLLACGVQQMQPRGIARMLYHTANQLGVQLPDAVKQILHIMAETAWQTSDVDHFDSCYPHLHLIGQAGTKEHDYEMDSVLRKMEGIHVTL